MKFSTDIFHAMYKQIILELEVTEISEDKLSLCLMDEQPKFQRDVSDYLGRAFLNHEFPATSVDFRILTIIIERFGSDCLKSVMRSYCKYMLIFTNQSTVQQLINLSSVQYKSSSYKLIAGLWKSLHSAD